MGAEREMTKDNDTWRIEEKIYALNNLFRPANRGLVETFKNQRIKISLKVIEH